MVKGKKKTLPYWIIKLSQACEHLLLSKEVGGDFKLLLKLMNLIGEKGI